MSKSIYEITEYDVSVETVTSSEATIASISTVIDGEIRTWTGTAKREPHDRFDPEIGKNLALSRAFAKASRKLEKAANGMVKSADDNRAQAAKSKAEAKERPEPQFHTLRSRRKSATKPRRTSVPQASTIS